MRFTKKLLVPMISGLFILAVAVPASAEEPIHHWSEASEEIKAEHSPEAIQSWIDGYWRQRWIDAYNWNKWMANAARIEQEKAEISACGGDLPPCRVVRRESKFDHRIWNGGCYAPYGYRGHRSPCGGSTASGKFQFIRGTWNGYGGYLNAADAPVSIQNAKAREVWAGGRGCSHWSAC